jgi:NAD(P)-dependent dehydrogenase (short-subunit alcohol dehydrogenase family)
MTATLITGANKGLGYETARRLLEQGHRVYLGARDPERGRAAARELGAQFLRLDVTDEDSVLAAVDELSEHEPALDVLVNNAGVVGGAQPPGETRAEALRQVYETNVFGVVTVTHAFLSLLQRAGAPVVVNVSSGMGSFGVTTDPARLESRFATLAYPSSKSALNMLTSQYARAYPGLRINAVDPGYTNTDMNAGRGDGSGKTVKQGAEVIVRMALIGADGPTGAFFDDEGPLPW